MNHQPNIISEIQVSYKPKIKACDRHTIKSSQDSYALIKSLYNENLINYKEIFLVLYLDVANKLIGFHEHSIGNDICTVVSQKQILAIALKSNASGIILCHNHPSGNLKPSSQDIELTKRIKEAAKLFEIKIIDHLIINEGYFSMADDGII